MKQIALIQNRQKVYFGLDHYISCLSQLTQEAYSNKGKDTLYLALDFVGYGHFSFSDLYYNNIFSNLQLLCNDKCARIITLTHSAQSAYVESTFIPGLVQNREKLWEKLKEYLDNDKNRNWLGPFFPKLENLLNEDVIMNMDSVQLCDLLTIAILTTEDSIQHALSGVYKVIYHVENMPIHIAVNPRSKVGLIAMHTTTPSGIREQLGIRIQDDYTGIQALKGTWDEYYDRISVENDTSKNNKIVPHQ